MHSFKAILALAVGFGLLFGAVAPAAAQQTTNSTAAGNQTSGIDADVRAPEGFEAQIDEHVTLNNWTYDRDRETFDVTLSVKQPVTVNINEVVSLDESGTDRINVRSELMPRGTHTIRFAARPGAGDEAAIVISTSRSINNGDATIISTGTVAQDLPFSRTSPSIGWVGGLSVMLLMTVAAGIQKIRKTHEAPREAR